jgi:outer membrane protein, heavy metal efflux system
MTNDEIPRKDEFRITKRVAAPLRAFRNSRFGVLSAFGICYSSFVLLVASLAGCTRFVPKPISPARNAAKLEARQLDDDGLKEFLEDNLGHSMERWPIESWDARTLIFTAFYFHPSLDVARAQLRVAQAGVRTAGGRPNPTLNLTPGYDFSAANGLSPWIPFFGVDVPVETAGKRGDRLERARHLSESARLTISTVAWQVRSNVRASLLDFAANNRRAMLLEKQSGVQEQIVKLLEQRLAAGAIARPELTTARIALNRTRLDRGEAKSRSAEARARLAESLGVSTHALEGAQLIFDFSRHPVSPLTAPEARQIALSSRSDILAALADYAAADAELRLQIARQYPDLHLNPGYQFDQGDNKWTLGMTFELPALNQNQGPIAEALGRRDEAGARFTELQAKVIGEIDRASAAYQAAGEQLTTTETLVAAERQQQQSVEAQLKAGAADSLDELNAQLELRVATLAELDGQARLQQALGALEGALQQPLDSMGGTSSTASLIHAPQRDLERSAKSPGGTDAPRP